MKRFLGCILAILVLCNPISYAQEKTDPPTHPTQSSASEKSNIPTINTNAEPDNEKAQKNANPIIPTDELAFDERALEVAKKANFYSKVQTIIGGIGLLMVGITAWFAWGAWRSSDDSVDVARRATTAEYQPYLAISDLEVIFHFSDDFDNIFEEEDLEENIHHYLLKRENMLQLDHRFTISNAGKTPAKDLWITYSGKITETPQIGDVLTWEIKSSNILCDFLDQIRPKERKGRFIVSPSTKVRVEDEKIPADRVHVDIEFRISFKDSFTENKRRVYAGQFFGNCGTRIVKVTNFAEVEAKDSDYPENHTA